MSPPSANPLLTQKDFEDFCYLPNLLSSSIGFDFVGKPRPMWHRVLRMCYFLLVCVSHFYIFTFIAKATFNMIRSDEFDLSLLLRLISGFNYAFFATVKSVIFIWHIKEFKEIFDNLKKIFPKTRIEKLIYKVRKHFWPKWILSVVYFYLGAVAFISTSPLIEGIILYIINGVKVGWRRAEFGYLKLYEIDYSFDHHSVIAYFITYSIEVMHAHFAVTFNICGDIWLLCFTLQLCMHLDYIARTLGNYVPNDKEFLKDQEFIGVLVKRHQILLK